MVEGFSPSARAYFAAGGVGILIGDGALTCRPEKVLEAYYAYSVSRWSLLTFDYQFIADPAYNADRGPVSVYSLRFSRGVLIDEESERRLSASRRGRREALRGVSIQTKHGRLPHHRHSCGRPLASGRAWSLGSARACGCSNGGILVMSRAIAFVACGFAVAACSLLDSSPPTDDLRFESAPPAAEVKTSSGQTCRTPCELHVQLVPELSATFALDGHEPQTVSLKRVPSQPIGTPRFSPNPVYVELQPAAVQPAAVMPPTKMRIKKKPAVAARTNNAPVASDDPAVPPPTAVPEPAMPSTIEFPGIVRSIEEPRPNKR